MFHHFVLCLLSTASSTIDSIFDVSVHNGTFINRTIDCGESQNCYILCDVPAACVSMKINASNTANLTVECTADSACYGFELMHGPTGYFNLICNASEACQYGSIDVTDAGHIDIYCDSNQTISQSDSGEIGKAQKGSCRGIDVVAVNAESVTMHCTAGCYEPSVQLQNVSDFWMECGYYSCYGALVNISSAESVNISCTKDDDPRYCLSAAEFHFDDAGAVSLSSSGVKGLLDSEVTVYGDSGHLSINCSSATYVCQNIDIHATEYQSRYEPNLKFRKCIFEYGDALFSLCTFTFVLISECQWNAIKSSPATG